jgi:hypothetical protein
MVKEHCTCVSCCVHLAALSNQPPNSLSLTRALYADLSLALSLLCVYANVDGDFFHPHIMCVRTPTRRVYTRSWGGGGHWFWRVSICDEEMMRARYLPELEWIHLLIDMRLLFHGCLKGICVCVLCFWQMGCVCQRRRLPKATSRRNFH